MNHEWKTLEFICALVCRFLLRRIPLRDARIHLRTRASTKLCADVEFCTIRARHSDRAGYNCGWVFKSVCERKVRIFIRFCDGAVRQSSTIPDRHASTECVATQTHTVSSIQVRIIWSWWLTNTHSHFTHRSNGSRHLCMLEDCPENRRLSFSQEAEHDQTNNFGMGTMLMHTEAMPKLICDETEALPNINGNAIAVVSAESPIVVDQKPELTCISEEGIADMDLPDNMIGVYPYADHITSCSKVRHHFSHSHFNRSNWRRSWSFIAGGKLFETKRIRK